MKKVGESTSTICSFIAESENIALRRPTRQSSVLGNNQFPSINAVNGIIDSCSSFIHTATSDRSLPWWEVDIEQTEVNEVAILNRVVGGKHRLRDLTISLFYENKLVLNSHLLN